MNKKYFVWIILFSFLLSSCADNIDTTNKNTTANEVSVNDTINNETNNMMGESNMMDDSNMMNSEDMNSMMNDMILKQEYYTPAWAYELDLKISFNWWKIANISASIENPTPVVEQFLNLFKDWINDKVVWMTLSEASQIDTISWASLTTWAFTDAINTKI